MLLIGKIVSTHGIKGELKIKSNHKFKDKVFKKDNEILIDNEIFIVNSHRIHKNLDMIKINNIDDINEVLKYVGKNIYVNDIKLNNNEYLDEDLIGFDVYMNNNNIGKIEYIEYIKNNNLLALNNNVYIPYNNNFINNIDFKNKRIDINYIEGLIE